MSEPNRIEGPVLVTGGAGFIGGQTVLCLLDCGVEVVVVDDLSTGRKRQFHSETSFYEGSIHDRTLIGKVIEHHGIQSILHFAGSIKVDESIENPLKYYYNNTEGSRRLIEVATRLKVENFIFSSTAAVYGFVPGGEPVDEAFNVNPLNPYGWSKLFTERTLQDVFTAAGPRYGILRYFNVAGADPAARHGQFIEKPVHLIGRAIEAAYGRAGPLQVFGDKLPTLDGTGVRDYIHVMDLAEAHIAALTTMQKKGAPLLTNLGYGRGYSVKQVIDTIEKVSGNRVPHEFVAAREGEAPSVIADIRHLHETMDWEPEHASLEGIVADSLSWIAKKSEKS